MKEVTKILGVDRATCYRYIQGSTYPEHGGRYSLPLFMNLAWEVP
ncbi:hypothetical protein ACFS7Z_25810 [Pontibacter toksunensis]|uniref:Helix-turn-helix domain-containing protein n=1 Tax=Pontibacter toksunensis TaxID=1332631 RepID=A0ABW6C810_9BACT